MGHQSTSGLFGTITKPPHLSQRTSGPRQPTKPPPAEEAGPNSASPVADKATVALDRFGHPSPDGARQIVHGWPASKCWAIRAVVMRATYPAIEQSCPSPPLHPTTCTLTTTCRYDLEYTQTRVRLRVSPSWPLAIQIVTFLRPLLAYPRQLGCIVKHHPTMPPRREAITPTTPNRRAGLVPSLFASRPSAQYCDSLSSSLYLASFVAMMHR
ncbi:hypothetical protein BM1_08162 [Bipolaris maydis]|nr:hypothetical protein BM1_08162 [Bipolaris maydis]